jgi:hypothetical protein
MSPPYKFLHQMYVRNEKMTVMKHDNKRDLGLGVLMQEAAVFAEGTVNVEEIKTPTLIVHGRHDGMHDIARAVELKRRMLNVEMLTVKDQGHVGVVAPAAQAITEFLCNLEPKRTVVPADCPLMLSKRKVLKMLAELEEKYEEPHFQSSLRAILGAAGEDHVRQMQHREKLCRQQQYKVIRKYGYAADRVGWLESLVAVGQFKSDLEVVSRQERLSVLLNPTAQSPEKSQQKSSSWLGPACAGAVAMVSHADNKDVAISAQ